MIPIRQNLITIIEGLYFLLNLTIPGEEYNELANRITEKEEQFRILSV